MAMAARLIVGPVSEGIGARWSLLVFIGTDSADFSMHVFGIFLQFIQRVYLSDIQTWQLAWLLAKAFCS